ncbi:MAG: prolipoprotein diacylglyceryl transferase [Oscillospiraceae bacterium]|nr:prolipoprotein diacylglyceryl transferase [Oscillospiraceae bacterium]
MHPFINIFGRPVPAYGLLMLTGICAAALMSWLLARKKAALDRTDVMLTFAVALAGGIVGSVTLRPVMKIVEVIVSWEKYETVPAGELFRYVFGEIVFYGGLLGILAAIYIFNRKNKKILIPLLDTYAPGIALGHAIGRVGCLFGGCCYGVPVSAHHPFAVVYPPESLSAPHGVPLLAAPLIEAVFLAALAVVLSVVCLKSGKPGLTASVYFMAYAVGRFILEFYRGDLIRGTYGGLTTSQYISIPLFLLGAAILVFYTFSKKKVPVTPS